MKPLTLMWGRGSVASNTSERANVSVGAIDLSDTLPGLIPALFTPHSWLFTSYYGDIYW